MGNDTVKRLAALTSMVATDNAYQECCRELRALDRQPSATERARKDELAYNAMRAERIAYELGRRLLLAEQEETHE